MANSRQTLTEEQKELRRKYARDWYECNKERQQKQQREYNKRRPKRTYTETQQIRNKERSQAYYIKNRDAIRARANSYYAANREKVQAQQRKASAEHRGIVRTSTLNRFGITRDDYMRILKEQDQVCAICGQPERAIRNGKATMLAVDHCHSLMKVRGLLCSACNTAIGLLKDSPERMRKAANYVESFFKALDAV